MYTNVYQFLSGGVNAIAINFKFYLLIDVQEINRPLHIIFEYHNMPIVVSGGVFINVDF